MDSEAWNAWCFMSIKDVIIQRDTFLSLSGKGNNNIPRKNQLDRNQPISEQWV